MCANFCVLHSGKSALIRELNHWSVHVRSITHSTMYQKAPFCKPELAYEIISYVACGFRSIKIDYSDYPKS